MEKVQKIAVWSRDERAVELAEALAKYKVAFAEIVDCPSMLAPEDVLLITSPKSGGIRITDNFLVSHSHTVPYECGTSKIVIWDLQEKEAPELPNKYELVALMQRVEELRGENGSWWQWPETEEQKRNRTKGNNHGPLAKNTDVRDFGPVPRPYASNCLLVFGQIKNWSTREDQSCFANFPYPFIRLYVAKQN